MTGSLIAQFTARSRSSQRAVRRADEALAGLGNRIPERLHETTRAVLVHFAVKEAAGLRVMFALGDETTPRPRSELSLITALLAELPPLVAAIETTELAIGGTDGTSSTNDAVTVEMVDADETS